MFPTKRAITSRKRTSSKPVFKGDRRYQRGSACANCMSCKLSNIFQILLVTIALGYVWRFNKTNIALLAQKRENLEVKDEIYRMKMERSELEKDLSNQNVANEKLKADMINQEVDIDEINDKLKKLEDEKIELTEKNIALQESLEVKFSKNEEKKEIILRNAKLETARIKAELKKVQKQFAEVETKNEQLQQSLVSLSENSEDFKKVYDRLEKEVVKYKNNAVLLEERIKEMEKDAKGYDSGTLSHEKEKLEKELIELRGKLEKTPEDTEISQKIKQVEKHMDELNGVSNLDEWMEQVETKVSELVTPVQEAVSQIASQAYDSETSRIAAEKISSALETLSTGINEMKEMTKSQAKAAMEKFSSIRKQIDEYFTNGSATKQQENAVVENN